MKNTFFNASIAEANGFKSIKGSITGAWAAVGKLEDGSRNSVLTLNVFDGSHTHQAKVNRRAFSRVLANTDSAIRDSIIAIFDGLKAIVDSNNVKAEARKELEQKLAGIEETANRLFAEGKSLDSLRAMSEFAEGNVLRKYSLTSLVDEKVTDRRITALQGQKVVLWTREKKAGQSYRTIDGTNPYTAKCDSVEVVVDCIDNEEIQFSFDVSAITATADDATADDAE